jgi:polysaccharide transporter, PST family
VSTGDDTGRRVARSAGMLMAFQLIGLALPLATLPVLTRALGVELFGRVMLAQFIVFFGVVFIDAGFNVESQRQVAIAANARVRVQVLLDNLLARGLLALVVALAVLLTGWLTPGLPLWMVLIALLHLLGTLLFPQWWFVAREQGLRMGLAATAGRAISAGVVLVFVRAPEDAGLALLAACSATALSGLMLAPWLLREFRQAPGPLDWQGYRRFLRTVRPVIFSGFVASSAQSAPTVVLGWIGGPLQVGVFSAADRLTRAAAHVSGVAAQSLLNVIARLHHTRDTDVGAAARRTLRMAALMCTAGALVLAVLAPMVVGLLYGQGFAASVPVLQLLAAWLGLYVFRSLWVMFEWTSRGRWVEVSRLQWEEGLGVIVLVGLGAWAAGATGVAAALVLAELGLLTHLLLIHRRRTGKEIR